MSEKRAELRQHFQTKENQAVKTKQHADLTAKLDGLEDTLVTAFEVLVKFMDRKVTKTEVVNQLKSISTPDVDKVVTAVSKLDQDILANKLDLKPVVQALNSMKRELGLIPKTLPKIPESKDNLRVSNLSEIKLDTTAVVDAIKALKLDVKAPIINEKDVDLKPLQDVMLDLLKAVNNQKPVEIPKFPTIPKTDLTKLEKKTDTSNKYLKEISEKKFGGGGGAGHSTPYLDTSGKASYVTLNADGTLPTAGGASESDYGYYQEEVTGTDEYYGFTNASGNWLLKYINTSTNIMGWATITNNSGESTYAGAWTNRASLTYGRKDEAF